VSSSLVPSLKVSSYELAFFANLLYWWEIYAFEGTAGIDQGPVNKLPKRSFQAFNLPPFKPPLSVIIADQPT
jgi:hypothetical protein